MQIGGLVGQARADKQVRQAEEEEIDERDRAGGPGEADAREQRLQRQREDDAAHAPARGGETGRLAAPAQEEMPEGGDGRGEDEGGAEPAEDAEDDEEVPVGLADAEEELRGQEQDAAGEDEVAGSARVEDGADLDPREEGEEGVDAEDPADGAVGLVRELVAAQVGVVGADGVHHAEGDGEAAEGAEHAEPGIESPFRVGVAVCVGGYAAGGGEVGGEVEESGWGGVGGSGARVRVAGMADGLFQVAAEVVAVWCCGDRNTVGVTRANAWSLLLRGR